MATRLFGAAVLLAFTAPVLAAAEAEWLALCGKCLNPTVTAKTGVGTEQAMAEARVTREAAQAWCANWQPDDKTCLKQQLSGEQNKVYRASADCLHGRLRAVDGNAYGLAGFWTSEVGRGRSKWKGADGSVVGQDEASGGLALAQQWELLCPGVTRITSGQQAGAAGTQVQLAQGQAPAQPAQAPMAESQSLPMQDSAAQAPSAFAPVDSPPANTSAQMPAASAPAPACAAPRCFNAGAFTATLTQLVEGQVGPRREAAVRIGITFRNTGTQPLVLAYSAGTSTLVDSVGSHFTIGPPNTPDSSAQGIGKVEGKNADTRFVLAPGEARDALFQLLKDRPGRAAAAGSTRYNYAVGIAQLDVVGNQVRLARAYRLGFQGIGPGVDASSRPAGSTSSASISDAVKDLESAAKKFGDLFEKK